jgi:hypothetical protein
MEHPVRQDIGDDLLSAIGLVIVTASAAHYAMTLQLLRLLNPKAISERDLAPTVITFGMKVDTTIGLLKTLIRGKRPHIADNFDRAADKLRASFTNKRDVLAHNTWNPGKKPNHIKAYKIKTVGSLHFAEPELTEKEIRRWADEILAEAKEIDELITGAGFPKLEPSRPPPIGPQSHPKAPKHRRPRAHTQKPIPDKA